MDPPSNLDYNGFEQKFKEYLGEDLFGHLQGLLVTSDSKVIVAGESVLSFYSDFDPISVDIYVDKSNINLIRNFYVEDLVNVGYEPPVFEIFLTKKQPNHVIGKLQFYHVSDALPIEILITDINAVDAVRDFDMDFTRCFWDGNNVYAFDKDAIDAKQGYISIEYTEYLLRTLDENLIYKIYIYFSRGFNIAYTNPEEHSGPAYDPDYEESSDLINIFHKYYNLLKLHSMLDTDKLILSYIRSDAEPMDTILLYLTAVSWGENQQRYIIKTLYDSLSESEKETLVDNLPGNMIRYTMPSFHELEIIENEGAVLPGGVGVVREPSDNEFERRFPSPPAPPEDDTEDERWELQGEEFENFDELQQAIKDWDTNKEALIAKYGPIKYWDVTNVEIMDKLFFMNEEFNEDISGWDMFNVQSMERMFSWSKFNQDISGWDVSNVKNMDSMFFNSPFNQPIGDWDVSGVRSMNNMFAMTNFNQDISEWDLISLRYCNGMFNNSEFNNGGNPQGLENWIINEDDIASWKDMFEDTPINGDGNLPSWYIDSIDDIINTIQPIIIRQPDPVDLWRAQQRILYPYLPSMTLEGGFGELPTMDPVTLEDLELGVDHYWKSGTTAQDWNVYFVEPTTGGAVVDLTATITPRQITLSNGTVFTKATGTTLTPVTDNDFHWNLADGNTWDWITTEGQTATTTFDATDATAYWDFKRRDVKSGCYEWIDGDINTLEFIKEDTHDNIGFVTGTEGNYNTTCMRRSDLKTMLEDREGNNLSYKCPGEGYHASTLDKSQTYFKLTLISHPSGVYVPVEYIVNIIENTDYNLFLVNCTGEKIDYSIGYTYAHRLIPGYDVSTWHCGPGTDLLLCTLIPINLEEEGVVIHEEESEEGVVIHEEESEVDTEEDGVVNSRDTESEQYNTDPHWKRAIHPGNSEVPRWKYMDKTVNYPLLTVDETVNEHKLAFVESGGNYRLADLMRIFDAWAVATDSSKPQTLEDDALFGDGGCQFRALTHRVLTGQGASIYRKYGYVPDFTKVSACNTSAYSQTNYDNDLRKLAKTPALIWVTITDYILPRKAAVLDIYKWDTLGTLLEQSPCDTRRIAYNDIGVALNKWRRTTSAPQALQPFLIAMCVMEMAHRHMVKI